MSSVSQPPYPPEPPEQPGFHPGVVTQDHPQATTALVLGILGLVLCGVLAPFAWIIGGRAVRDIDASRGTLGGRGSANAGKILGIVGTVLLVLLVVLVIGLFGFSILASSVVQGSCTTVGTNAAAIGC